MSADLHPTAQQLCTAAGISRRMFFNALKVRRNGCEELNDLVKSGGVSMNLALEVARFDHAGQRLILAEFPTIKLRDRAGVVALIRLAHEQEKECANG
ncbi:hypothetical protein [Polaromonas sp. DSR2-3-2]|uniref:hypothetical protein n=1 Tax=unclassified Polaromonas TaxID=2638319 RepID=UPI003CEB1781